MGNLTVDACYGLASGSIADPGNAPVAETMKLFERLGLSFGADERIMAELGPLGTTLISRASFGTKALEGGDLVLAFGGAQPGCRIILMIHDPVEVTDAVAALLLVRGWKPVSTAMPSSAGLERRMFLRRDANGAAYLLNLLALHAPQTNIRLVTTTIRVPPGVQLPAGF